MDADFINTYTEVLLENAEAVIRQNFMLQARLKVMEKTLVEKEKEKKEFEENLQKTSNGDTEKETLKSIISLSDEDVKNKVGEIKESLYNKVNTLLSESTDNSFKDKLTDVKKEMDSMSPTKYNYYRLKELQNGLD